MRQVEELTRQAAAALPQAPARNAASSSGRDAAAAPKWNVHPTSTKARSPAPQAALPAILLHALSTVGPVVAGEHLPMQF